MIFSKENLIEVLHLNLGYEIVEDDIFGPCLSIDPRTAYRFCLTTNSYYIVDKYGLRLFGLYRTFNHRNLSLNVGLFNLDYIKNEISDENLPHTIFNRYPSILLSDKKIVFIESHNTSEALAEAYDKIISFGRIPENYIINFIHSNGSQWEHYFEYIASEIFIEKGFLTDIQLPWSYRGKPDFGIYKHEIVNDLRSYGFIKNGALILELSAIKKFGRVDNRIDSKIYSSDSYEFAVGEVKTWQLSSQILSYLETGICFKGYEFIPNKKNREIFSGLIKIDDNNILSIEEAPLSDYLDYEKVEKDMKWFDIYLNIHLLGNFNLDEIKKIMLDKLKSDKLSFSNVIKLVQKLNYKDLLERI